MWRFTPPAENRSEEGRISCARRTRSNRPRCTPLEERCLLSVSLAGNKPSVSPVGVRITWTAKAGGHGKTPVYQFRAGPAGGTSHVIRDFSRSNSVTWDAQQEGDYVIQVTVKDGFGSASGESTGASYSARSRVAGSGAVISRTQNPLVTLYSAPPSAGTSMYVEFSRQGPAPSWRRTDPLPVVPGRSTNFLIAGLLPRTTYLLRHVLDDGTTSAPLTFRTGALPRNLPFPTFAVRKAPPPGTDVSQDVVFHVGTNPAGGTINTLATNLGGKVVWYYDSITNRFPGYAPSLAPGGTVLMLGGKQDGVGGANTLREVDLAGNTLRETSVAAVTSQLAALGRPSITDFNHEAQRLPNGDTAVLATTPRTVLVNGRPIRYNGDMVLVLDQDFRVVWSWDPFAWLNTNRLPTDGEGPGDWLHANAIAWSPADGNLLVSLRSQDWVVKIDYANGTGDGHVLWRLGPDGDFRINAADPSPWFTHQHDVRYVDASTLVLFDNGNIRHRANPAAHSRGQELVLDEAARTVTLAVNADLGSYAFAVGGAQRLPDGTFAFTSGFVEKTFRVRADGSRVYVLQMRMPGLQYRSYIEPSLFVRPVYVS